MSEEASSAFRRWCEDKNSVAALEALDRILAAEPRSALAWFFKGTIRLAGGDARLAIKDFDRAIGADPSLAVAWANRSRARSAAGQVRKAIADVERAIALDPNDPALPAWRDELVTRNPPLGWRDWVPFVVCVLAAAGSGYLVGRGGPGTHENPGIAEIDQARPPDRCSYKSCDRAATGSHELTIESAGERRATGGGHTEVGPGRASEARLGLCDEHAAWHKEKRWPNVAWVHWGMTALVTVVGAMIAFVALYLMGAVKV